MTATAERPLKDSFTSTGAKFWEHQEALNGLRDGSARCVTTHLMPTDICQDTCSFCSVLTRDGKVLRLADMLEYVDTLRDYGLKSVIVSGGGNPLLYRCPESKQGISELIMALNERGLEVGMITNGMKLRDYGGRTSYATLTPGALDSLTWLRVSMSGLDHERGVVEVPDVDPKRTTLGFSYVLHDTYLCPTEPNHGKVSTMDDLIRLGGDVGQKPIRGVDRLADLTEQIGGYVERYRPRYVRLLPNCLEPAQIPERCAMLQGVADAIDPQVVFVQQKPPRAPSACYLGYLHPVLNSDGYVYPCDSVVLNKAAGHKFANPWRICHMKDIAGLYDAPVRSLLDSKRLCPGCVFSGSNDLLTRVVGGEPFPQASGNVTHPNFV